MADGMTLEEIIGRIWRLNGDSEPHIHKQQAEALTVLAYKTGFKDGNAENVDPAGDAHAVRLARADGYTCGYEAGKRDARPYKECCEESARGYSCRCDE